MTHNLTKNNLPVPWNPDAWQDVNMRLAHLFHRGAFQKIPDSHQGDGGLEGFSKDELVVGYQCYALEDDAETPIPDRIIKKMNDDTLKLQKNEKFFADSFGPLRMKQWTLLVPPEKFKGRKFVQQAGRRAEEVKRWKLPFIADDFRITVSDGSEFDTTREKLRELEMARLAIEPVPLTDEAKKEWETLRAKEVPILDQKLGAMDRPADLVEQIRDQLIECAVVAQNAFKRLEKEDPDGWERLVKAKAAKGRELRTESLLNNKIPSEFLQKVINDYKAISLSVMPTLDDEAARILTNEAVVEWLLTCPLKFNRLAQQPNDK